MSESKGKIPAHIKPKEFHHPAKDRMVLILCEVQDPRKPSCNFRHSLVTIIFISFVLDSVGDIIAIDGKTLRGTRGWNENDRPLLVEKVIDEAEACFACREYAPKIDEGNEKGNQINYY